MMWNETSKWAKEKGFKMKRVDGLVHWQKMDDPEVCGIEENVDDVAKAIFNVITDYKWVGYQNSLKPK